MSPAVELERLSVRYGEVEALLEASLRVERGRVCGLVGMNGAGKSTLLKAVLGLVVPSSGSVRVLGRPVEEVRRAARIAYVPQDEEIDKAFPLSVREVVTGGRAGSLRLLRGVSAQDREAVAAAIERVGLAALAERQIGALSGGQRKRAFVARAIAQGAELLLLDEPFAGVDLDTQDALVALLRELAAEGTTALVSTHDVDNAPALCDEIALVARTVLLHSSPAEALRPENLALAFRRAA